MNKNLRDLTHEVADARDEEATLIHEWKMLVAQFEQDHAILRERMAAAQDNTARAEVELRRCALEDYDVWHEKSPGYGVTIKEFLTVIYDAGEALAWAKEHSLALALDKKAFEAIAKTQALPFVKIGSEPRVQLATDMRKALVEEQQ